MRRILSVVILCVMALGLLTGCGAKGGKTAAGVTGYEYGPMGVTGYEYGLRGVTGYEYGPRGVTGYEYSRG